MNTVGLAQSSKRLGKNKAHTHTEIKSNVNSI